MADDVIQENDWVILDSSDGKKTLGLLSKGSSARIGSRKRKLVTLIGHRWGQLFAVPQKKDVLIPIPDLPERESSHETDMDTMRNNQNLIDDTGNQKLKQEAIVDMQARGVQGEELVQTVANNSSTFKNKTAFSQQKYLKRKRAKFDLKVRVMKPTAFSLCETYFTRSPEKTLHLRVDALGMLLAYGGVRAGARVLVYENCTGLLTGAIAERMAGLGKIINVFGGNTPPGTEVIKMLSLASEQIASIVHTPIELLTTLETDEAIDDQPLRYGSREDLEADRTKEMHMPSAKRAEAIATRPKRGVLKSWIKDGCDCLVVATRYDVVKVFDMLLKHVAPSGSFVAYCMHLQNAADLQYALQLSQMAVRVELMELSLVNHQVLPGRSHPAMTDSATGGYIVSGIRILLED